MFWFFPEGPPVAFIKQLVNSERYEQVKEKKKKKRFALLVRSYTVTYSNLKLPSLKGIPSENRYGIKDEALTDPDAVWSQRIELCCHSVREKRKRSNLPSGIRQTHEEFDLVNWSWHVRGGFIVQRRHTDRKSELNFAARLQMDVTER